MDFMKVLDQTVREIKREVNLKVLKVPEIEQKVLDATSDEPWGPHGSDLADIARATKRYAECAMIMNVLWQRMADAGANWRHVYKALAVIEYLLANGAERAVDDIIDNSSRIAKLTSFEHVEPNGKDVGLSVRKKAETVLAVVDDREKLQQVREKAAATRDKYFGLSSTGITYKSSAAAFGSGSYSSGTHGSTGSSWGAELFRDSYRGKEWSNRSKETVPGYGSTRNQDSSISHMKPSSDLNATSRDASLLKMSNEEDDDFNPRGSSTSAATAKASSERVNLFGRSLIDDLVDTNTSTSTAMRNAPEVDLFADAAFQSATVPFETANGSHAQNNIDLFGGRSSFTGSVTSETEFSVRDNPNKYTEKNSSSPVYPSGSALDPSQQSFATQVPSELKFPVYGTPSEFLEGKISTTQHASAVAFDPSATIPLKSFDGFNSFEAFSSSTRSVLTEQRHDPPGGVKSFDHSPLEDLSFGAFTSHTESPTASPMKPMNKSPTKLEAASLSVSQPDVKKETFQVKSGVWADSLSRGLINLNITAPKKVDLSNVGVVGRLSDESDDNGLAAPRYMGTTVGTGSSLGGTNFPSSTGTNFQQQQFANFK